MSESLPVAESMVASWDTLIQQVEQVTCPLVAEVLRLQGDRHVVEQVIRQLRERTDQPQQVHVVRVYRDRSGMYRQAAFRDQAIAATWGQKTAGTTCRWSADTLEIDREVNRG